MASELKRFINKQTVAAAGMVVSWIVARLKLPGVEGSAAQTLVMAGAMIGVLVVTWQEVRRRAGPALAVLACLVLAIILPTMASFLIHKPLEVDGRLPPSPVLASRLADSCTREIRNTPYNAITRVGRPVVARDGQGRIHVLLDFEWRKSERSIVGVHVYEGSAYLQAGTRTAEGGSTVIDPFKLSDFSIGPKQGMWAYLGGWYELPFLKSEARFITLKVSECLGAG